MFRKREELSAPVSQLTLRLNAEWQRVPAAALRLFVERLNAYERGLVQLVAWFLGYYLGDPVLDWIVRVPHLIESVKGLDAECKWRKLDYDGFAAGEHLSEEDCKVFLRIMYPRCRNSLRQQNWCEKKNRWVEGGAADMLLSKAGSKIVGCRRRCGKCSQHHPLRLLQVLEKRLGAGRLRHLFPYAAYIIRLPPPDKYVQDLRSSCWSSYICKELLYEVDWCDKFRKACRELIPKCGVPELIRVMKYQVPKKLWIEEYNRASHRHETGPKQHAHLAKFRCHTHWVAVPESEYHAVWCDDPTYPLELEQTRPYSEYRLGISMGVFVPQEWKEGPVYDHVYLLPN